MELDYLGVSLNGAGLTNRRNIKRVRTTHTVLAELRRLGLFKYAIYSVHCIAAYKTLVQSRWEYALNLVPLARLLKEAIKGVELAFMRQIFGRRAAKKLPRFRAACRIRKVEDRRTLLARLMIQRVQRRLETLS